MPCQLDCPCRHMFMATIFYTAWHTRSTYILPVVGADPWLKRLLLFFSFPLWRLVKVSNSGMCASLWSLLVYVCQMSYLLAHVLLLLILAAFCTSEEKYWLFQISFSLCPPGFLCHLLLSVHVRCRQLSWGHGWLCLKSNWRILHLIVGHDWWEQVSWTIGCT